MKKITLVIALLFLCLCVSSVYLTVKLGPEIHYKSENGELFTARYGSLSDSSLNFVKITMPDGRKFTLPQLISGSGVRYTDDRELVWWEHQGTVRVDTRGPDGSWETKYTELKQAP